MASIKRLYALLRDALDNVEANGDGAELRAMSLDEQVTDICDRRDDIARYRHRDVFQALSDIRKEKVPA